MPLSTEPPYFLAAKSDTTPFTGTGPNADRQEGSHLHQVAPHPTYDELFVPDLGADKVRRLVRGSSGRWVEEGAVDFKPGSGPRHVAFHGASLSLPPFPHACETQLQSPDRVSYPPRPRFPFYLP